MSCLSPRRRSARSMALPGLSRRVAQSREKPATAESGRSLPVCDDAIDKGACPWAKIWKHAGACRLSGGECVAGIGNRRNHSELGHEACLCSGSASYGPNAERGYNQAEKLACSFAGKTGGIVFRALFRKTFRVSQTTLSKTGRANNVSGSFWMEKAGFLARWLYVCHCR